MNEILINFEENRHFMTSFARDRNRTSYVGSIEKFFAICYNLRGKQKYEKRQRLRSAREDP